MGHQGWKRNDGYLSGDIRETDRERVREGERAREREGEREREREA